jgi:hypothetical protein
MYLALYLCKGRPGFLFGPIAATQLLSLSVGCSRVDGELIADDRLAAGAASELNASDLWWQLAALSHSGGALRRGFGVGSDEAMNLCRGSPARRPDLDPRQLAGIEKPVDR